MTTDTDILAALGGSIPAARKMLQEVRDDGTLNKHGEAIFDLALRALDAMERPAGGDERLRKLRGVLLKARARNWESFMENQGAVGNVYSQRVATIDWVLKELDPSKSSDDLDDLDRLLSEPAPASDGRTGSCAECERLTRERDAARADQAAMDAALSRENEEIMAHVQRAHDALREAMKDKCMPTEWGAEIAARHEFGELEKAANPPASPDGSTADAEARIAEFVEKVNKAINAMCDPTSPNFARGPVEVRAGMDAIRERTVVMLRSLAADAEAARHPGMDAVHAALDRAGVPRNADCGGAVLKPLMPTERIELLAAKPDAEAARNDVAVRALEELCRYACDLNHGQPGAMAKMLAHKDAMVANLRADAAKPDAGDDAQEGDEADLLEEVWQGRSDPCQSMIQLHYDASEDDWRHATVEALDDLKWMALWCRRALRVVPAAQEGDEVWRRAEEATAEVVDSATRAALRHVINCARALRGGAK